MNDLFGPPKPNEPGWRNRQGKEAFDNGAEFESRFETMAALYGFAVTRMPSGCRQVGKRLVRVKTVLDWIISKSGQTILIDTKTTTAARFPHAKIESHQALGLSLHEHRDVRSGYVVELRKISRVIFIPASLLMTKLRAGPGSIGIGDPGVIDLGTSTNFDLRSLLRSG